MKKIQLTEEEKNSLKEIQEILRQVIVSTKKKDKMIADFWYNLVQRRSGNYTTDFNNGEIYELSFEEVRSENKK